MNFLQKAAIAAVSIVFVSTAAIAGDGHKAGDLTVTDGWARASATPVAKAGAAYIGVQNTGAHDDVLVSATSPVAKRVEIHTHKHENGVMKMRPAGDVTVSAGHGIAMEPGGLHVMLMGLKKPLKEGEHFPVTLTFKNAGDVTVPVMTLGVAASGPAHGHEGGQHGHGQHGHGQHGTKTTN